MRSSQAIAKGSWGATGSSEEGEMAVCVAEGTYHRGAGCLRDREAFPELGGTQVTWTGRGTNKMAAV